MFKAGDWVRCERGGQYSLVEGAIYRVDSLDGDSWPMVLASGFSEAKPFNPDRFIPWQPQAGDWVTSGGVKEHHECVENIRENGTECVYTNNQGWDRVKDIEPVLGKAPAKVDGGGSPAVSNAPGSGPTDLATPAAVLPDYIGASERQVAAMMARRLAERDYERSRHAQEADEDNRTLVVRAHDEERQKPRRKPWRPEPCRTGVWPFLE